MTDDKKEIYEYWNKRMLYGWGPYEDMRKLRYGLHTFLPGYFNFDECKGKKVLEIGCGCGVDAVEHALHGAEMYAIDLTESAVNYTKKLFESLELEAGDIRQADATLGLPYEDNFFDMVYSIGVIHHSPEPEKIVKEMHRVLKPGGDICVLLYHKDSLLYYFSILYLGGIVKHGFADGLSEKQLLCRYSEAVDGCPYTAVYTVEEARSLFSPYFKDIAISIELPAVNTMTERKKLFPGVPKNLGWHLIVKAVKA
jgi:ubiquinone/menaquinone biosynthesis C-methylase UbiE